MAKTRTDIKRGTSLRWYGLLSLVLSPGLSVQPPQFKERR